LGCAKKLCASAQDHGRWRHAVGTRRKALLLLSAASTPCGRVYDRQRGAALKAIHFFSTPYTTSTQTKGVTLLSILARTGQICGCMFALLQKFNGSLTKNAGMTCEVTCGAL
jgi:adenylyl- and sulfurtransferase ThiI